MSARRISITLPPSCLEKLDAWAKEQGISRSRFVVQAVEQQIQKFEEEEITRRFNEVCSDPDTAACDQDLAEEMLTLQREDIPLWTRHKETRSRKSSV